jgi:hypothetical protein
MNRTLLNLSLYLLSTICLQSQTLEKWTLTDGRSFEGQVKSVTPGMVIFARASGPDAPLEIAQLSELSQRRLMVVLGLTLTTTPNTAIPPPAPTAPPPSAPPMNTTVRDPGAIDATDISMIDSKFGLRCMVTGKISKIRTLGSTGHKKINFENSEFYLFINKRILEANPEWKPETMANKRIQVEGEVAKYQDQLQIQITAPTQINVVEF